MIGLLAIALLAMAAYARSFQAPFIFDDIAAVRENPSIRAWWDFARVFSPPVGLSVSGRPVVNFSLALSYALSGEQSWGYHAVNFLVHLTSGALLFGLVRRTLRRPLLVKKFGVTADATAWAVTAIWVLHPLQTATVAYVMQRTEALMTLSYLATFYFFARGVEAKKPVGWWSAAVAVCSLGMGSKEVMVSAPLMICLYDRTFVAGGFGAAWRQRKFFYGALAATWLVLGALVLGTDNRSGSAGWGAGVSASAYVLTQGGAILHYLRLALWPAPLVFDYGTALTPDAGALAVVGGLVAATIVALVRWPAVGFCAAFFFAVLAPTSSFVPVATQTMAEHRIYFPLAAVVVLAVAGAHAAWGRTVFWVWPVLATAAAVATGVRNETYRSEHALWSDTVAKRPGNARAHFNLGVVLATEGDVGAAERAWEETIRLEPAHAAAHGKLAQLLVQSGRANAALEHFEAALRAGKVDGAMLNNWGGALLVAGRAREALEKFQAAEKLMPASAEVRFNRGNALVALGRGIEAQEAFRAALRLRPDYFEAHYNLGTALAESARYEEALREFEESLRLAPTDPAARRNVASLRAYLRK